MKYFSNTPQDGFQLHETECGAINAALDALKNEIDNVGLSGEWSETVEDIMWGVVSESAQLVKEDCGGFDFVLKKVEA